MNFKDIGIIISKKPFKENLKLITLFTKNHGLFSGIIRISSKKSDSIYNEGNLVDFFWQARLHEHIGNAKCELIRAYSGMLITNKTKLYAFNSIISLIKLAFHEREPHNNFFPIFEAYISNLTQEFKFKDYVNLELEILNEAGYRLQLNSCAVTGSSENLSYVSPKSGKAISYNAGAFYADKLLKLPKFLNFDVSEISRSEQTEAFDLLNYFFNRYIFHHNLPQARKTFIEYILSI